LASGGLTPLTQHWSRQAATDQSAAKSAHSKELNPFFNQLE
jgi:hypothetical protein